MTSDMTRDILKILDVGVVISVDPVDVTICRDLQRTLIASELSMKKVEL